MRYHFYDFVLFKRDGASLPGMGGYKWFTQYTVKAEKQYDDKSFSFVASRLVLAERVMLFDTTLIERVVVYEYENNRYYDDTTITHTLYPGDFVFNGIDNPLLGARTGPHVDAFHGLQWKRNSRPGKAFQGYFPGCVGYDDAWNPGVGTRERERVVLNATGPLASRCWPFYANQLATMPQIQDVQSIDRYGAGHQFEEQTSGRRISHVSNMAALRRRRYKNLPGYRYVDALLSIAHQHMREGLQQYHAAMNEFDHVWGDGHFPANYAGMQKLYALSAVWYPLMSFFQYAVSDPDYGHLLPYYDTEAHSNVKRRFGGRWKSHGREIDSCLRGLFHCQQNIEYFFGLTTGREGGETYWDVWRSQKWTDDEARYLAIYQDWDQVTELFFKAVDCLNVLSMTLEVKEKAPLRGALGPMAVGGLGGHLLPNSTYPGAVPFVPMVEIYPMDAAPFYNFVVPLPPAPPPPPVEEIPWDSGPSDEIWDDGNDSFAYQMKEAVRNALAKLEFVRRWIGKIRKQILYYRGVPIEKLAPQNDEVQNPINGDDVPDSPF